MRFAQPHPPQIVSSEMSALRFAFVGCGGIARHHLKALRSCAHPTRVVAVVDIKRENATEFCDLIPQDQAQDCQVGVCIPAGQPASCKLLAYNIARCLSASKRGVTFIC